MAVLLETSLGDIVVDLYVEERPKSSLNFLKLCKIKYYNYNLFHSVQRNYIAQSGDPTGTGNGGESIWGALKGEDYRFFEAETNPRLKHLKTGTLSMVNNGNDCHSSQFFLTLGEGLDYLDGVHTVFGEVTEGMDVLMKVSEAYCDKDGHPYQDIRIYHTVVLEDPFDDPEGLVVPERSPSPPKVITDSNRIGAEEDIDDYKGLTEEQIRELIAQREAKANAQILEMVGDIPDADAKPPENVLFVCKLNPVTTDEDLEIIFSRFGPILSCEVIRDQKTGDSLQYAFIEFENEEDCIKAYFKMDNVLIDDRRIHVDFSQSLAKVKGLSRRKYSEEEGEVGREDREKQSKKDGLVATKQAKDDGYEMVFATSDGGGGGGGGGGGDGERKRRRERKEKKDDKDDDDDDDEEEERRRRRRKDEQRRRERSRSREGRARESSRRDRDREGGHHHRRRSRSRSRSRDRHHHHHHRQRRHERDRSLSRERKHKRRRSRSRDRH